MKKLVCIILMIIMFVPFTAAAEEPLSIHLENFQTQPNELNIYFNTNFNGEVTISQLSLSLGGKAVPIKEIVQCISSEHGSTFLFLVDVSGSIKDRKLEGMKAILNHIADSFSNNDNAAVMLVGNHYIVNSFEYGNEPVKQQIAAIKGSGEDTNLYKAIIKGLGILNTNPLVQTKKCMIILSDGKDDYSTGYTREEVNLKIQEAHIPIHTVAMVEENAAAEFIEASKVLGSFARLSAGGRDITYDVDDITSKEISELILKAFEQGYILTADISSLDITKDQQYLELKLETGEIGVAYDGYMINTASVNEFVMPSSSIYDEEGIVLAAAGLEEESKQVEGKTVDQVRQKKKRPFVAFILSAAVIASLSALLYRLQRKNKRLYSSKEIDSELISEEPIISEQSAVKTIATINKILSFTKIGILEGETYTVPLDQEIVIGRDAVRAQFVFEKDELLSSQHCKISLKNQRLFIEDLGSTNGTYLNGVPVMEPQLLEQDDIIMIGSMELRINWNE